MALSHRWVGPMADCAGAHVGAVRDRIGRCDHQGREYCALTVRLDERVPARWSHWADRGRGAIGEGAVRLIAGFWMTVERGEDTDASPLLSVVENCRWLGASRASKIVKLAAERRSLVAERRQRIEQHDRDHTKELSWWHAEQADCVTAARQFDEDDGLIADLVGVTNMRMRRLFGAERAARRGRRCEDRPGRTPCQRLSRLTRTRKNQSC